MSTIQTPKFDTRKKIMEADKLPAKTLGKVTFLRMRIPATTTNAMAPYDHQKFGVKIVKLWKYSAYRMLLISKSLRNIAKRGRINENFLSEK